MTMSTATPRRSSSGTSVAALPTTPTESARRCALAASASATRLIQRGGDLVQVAVLHPAGKPGRVDVDDQADAAVHGHGQRLRSAHAAAARGQGERAGQGARVRRAVELGGDRGERLVGALQDALGSDVDPGSGGHLPVHGQARAPPAGGTPARWPSRRPGWSWRCSTRGAHSWVRNTPTGRPDWTSMVSSSPSVRQGADQGVEGRPVARRLAGAAVDDQVLRALGHVGVEVVHEHAQRGLLRPCLRGECGSSGGADCIHHVGTA